MQKNLRNIQVDENGVVIENKIDTELSKTSDGFYMYPVAISKDKKHNYTVSVVLKNSVGNRLTAEIKLEQNQVDNINFDTDNFLDQISADSRKVVNAPIKICYLKNTYDDGQINIKCLMVIDFKGTKISKRMPKDFNKLIKKAFGTEKSFDKFLIQSQVAEIQNLIDESVSNESIEDFTKEE